MKRSTGLVVLVFACMAWSGVALAQAPQPGPPQGTGRGGFAPVVIGPPAPVPPEVTIPRPTPAELAEVNATVKKFIDSDTSPTKALLKKFESLLMLLSRRA